MKKQSPKQRGLHAGNHLWYCIISVSFFAFISCKHQSSSPAENDKVKKSQTINNIRKNSFDAPKVTRITARNQPKVVKAGKPVIKIDSSGVGIPFFTNYDIDQGLPVNNIICSATDKAGNLWFGTGGGGVSKYDGKSFTNYTMAHGLAGNIVFYIVEDKGGNLWFATTSGVSKYDGSHFTNYTTAKGLADNFVTCIIQDSRGNLWFSTHEGGVSKFDGKSFTNYTTAQGLADNYVRCIIQDTKGNIWFGTDAGGVSKYDGSTFTNYTKAHGLVNNSINSIAEDKAGNLWFGTNAGVNRYDGSRFTNYTTTKGLADNNVFCIVQDKDGNLWFGTHTRGVSKFDGSRFTNYTRTEGLAENIVNSILQDRVGNLWFSSQGGGVSKYEGSSFTNYTTDNGLPDNFVICIIQDSKDNIWFGTYEGGVSKFDGKSFTNYTTTQGLADNFVHCMIRDRKGNLWFGTDRGGVSKYEGNSFTNYTTAQGLPSNAVITMMQDKAGNIWFGTRASGVSKYDGKSFTNYTTANGLAGNNIWSIVQDKAGSIWFGTHDGGASKYDGNSFTNYTTAQGLPGNAISAIQQDKNANLWFGTDGKGVSKYDGKNFTNYTTEHGLADDEIWNIAEDPIKNIIWFGTNRGLSGLKQKSSTNSNKQEHEFENFNKNTGYPIKDVSTGALLVDKKGIVWAGSGEGKLIRFDYSTVHKNTDALNLKIQAVKLNNETICWNNLLRKQQGNKALDSLTLLNEMITSFGKVLAPKDLDSIRKKYRDIQLDGVTRFYPVPINLLLPYNFNNISIDFVAIEPARPKQVKYQYKLEGYSDDWSPLSNNSTAVFGNISGGNYTFKLKALSPFGIWSETQYSFKVLPPWWLTWWAYTLYGLMTAAVLYTFYRARILRIERRQATQISIMVATQEEERKRISRDLHDDIGARLTNINMLSALGQQKINEPQETSDYLKRISNEIQTSVEALDDIVWSIDSKNDSIEEVTARMRRYAADVFDGTTIRYTITVDEKSLPAKLSVGKRRDVFFVFKETINNIQKHAMATEVNINIEAKDNNLLMQVNDNGRGFDTDQPTHRNGLKNIEQRMQKWGGICMVQSSPGKGAILQITFPVSTPSLKRGMREWFKNR